MYKIVQDYHKNWYLIDCDYEGLFDGYCDDLWGYHNDPNIENVPEMPSGIMRIDNPQDIEFSYPMTLKGEECIV
jgi:hypothetical protein